MQVINVLFCNWVPYIAMSFFQLLVFSVLFFFQFLLPKNIFNPMCSQSFFSSDEIYAGLLHILTAIGVPIHLFGGYMIFTKTPRKMQSVKSNMLLLHCVGAFLDVWFSFIAIPVITIPGCSGYFLGVTVSLGIPTVVQSYLCISFAGALAVTILTFFEDRYNRLVKNGEVNWKRAIYVVIHYTYAIVFPIPGYLNIPEQESAKVVHKQMIPCIPSDVINRPDYFVLTITDKTIIYCIFSIAILVLSQVFIFIGCISWHLFHMNLVSQNTARLQKQFFLALCIQVTTPLILLSVPVFYIVFAIHFDYYNQAATNIAVATISCHGIFSTVIMLAVHTPYRIATLGIFKSKRAKTTYNSQNAWASAKY